MKNIVYSRIDDRLIHGQVMTAWVQFTQATDVIIVDDRVAKDDFSKMVMKSSMPAKIGLTILDTKDAIQFLLGDPANSNEKIFILAKTPMTFLDLVNAKVDIKQLGIGGMGAKPERTTFYRNISASQEERDCLVDIAKKGVDVFAQVIPDQEKVGLKTIISY